MKFRLASGSLFALAFATACGGEKPQPVTAATPPAPVQAGPDLSPVKAPPTLLAWARATDPGKTAATAFGFIGLPAPGGEVLGELLDMKEIAALADIKAPLEAAVFLAGERSPKPRALVSIPLRSGSEARQKLARYKLGEEGGVTTLSFEAAAEARDPEGSGGASSDRLCLIAPAVGRKAGIAQGHRLICGRKDTLDSYAPYMTRTLPTVPSSGAVYGELFMKPVRGPARELGRMANSLKLLLDAPELAGLVDIALLAAADTVDATQDLETAFVRADLTDTGLRATAGLRFGSAKSTLASWLVSHPERSNSGPAGIEKSPAEPSLALFNHGSDLSAFDKALDTLREKLVELAKREKFPEAERTQLEDLLSRTKAYAAHAATSTRGFDDAAAEKALTALQASKPGAAQQKARYAATDALEGWHAYYSETKQDEIIKLLSDWGKMLSSPALRKWIVAEATKLDGKKDKGGSSDLKRVLDLFTIKVKTSKAPASYGLPAGTDLVEFTVPRLASLTPNEPPMAPPMPGKKPAPAKKPTLPKPVPVTYKLFVTSDGAATISVYSANAKLAATKLKEALAHEGGKSEPVKKLATMNASGGGYFTLRAAAAVMLETTLNTPEMPERNLRRFRNASKDQGVFFSWRTLAPSADAAGGSVELDLELPQKAIVAGISLFR